MLKAVFCDVDGTLTGHAAKPTNPDIRKSIQHLRRRGVLFGIATSHAFDEPLTRRFYKYYDFDYMALENGSDIYIRKARGIYARSIKYARQTARVRGQLWRLAEVLRKAAGRADTPAPFGTARAGAETLVIGQCRVAVQYRQASMLLRAERARDDLRPVIRKLRAAAAQHRWRIKFIEPRRDFVELAVANKAEGVRFLCRHWGLAARDICAIGDGDNDEEMLAMAGLPACPSDAPPRLKRIVQRRRGMIAPEIEYWGVRDIMRALAANHAF